VYGAELPWSQMIIAYARRTSAPGRSSILGSGGGPVQAGAAALANGAMTHAFELDSLTKPDSGSHPGATVFTAALAVAQQRGASGRDLLTAFVAGGAAKVPSGGRPQHTQQDARLSGPGRPAPRGRSVQRSQPGA